VPHDSRYPRSVRVFHWLIAFCIIAGLMLIEFKGYAPKGSDLRRAMAIGHMQFGIAVLLLFLPRLWFALRSPAPAVSPPMARWQALASKAMHVALYLLLIATPVLGFVLAQAEGKELSFLGVPLPVLVAKDHAFAEQLEEVHGLLGESMMYLAILHAAFAFFHHWVQKDDTLLRMLPARRGLAGS